MFLGLKDFDGEMDDVTIPICAPFSRVAQNHLMRNSLKARLFVRPFIWTETRICVTVKRGYLQKTALLCSE
jgi:hypothetical protein